MLPSFTRADAAVFYAITERIRGQLNVENLLDATDFVTAHSNTNITPGRRARQGAATPAASA